MDFRKYDIYIDGQKLPDSVMGHIQTQVGQRVNLAFNGNVRNVDTNHACTRTQQPYAALGGTVITFVLLPDENESPSVRITTQSTDLRWCLQSDQNIHPLQSGTWWELGWGNTYVLSRNTLPATSMTLRVERYRIPLAPVDSKMNRTAQTQLRRLRNI